MHVRLFVLCGDGNVHSLLHALQDGVRKAKESDRQVSCAGSGVFLDFVAYHTVKKTDTDDVASHGMVDHLLRFEQSTVDLREIEGREILGLDENVVQLRETVPENQRIGEDGNAGDRAMLEEELLTSLNLLAIEP